MWARVYADGVFGSGSPSPHRSKVDVDAERDGVDMSVVHVFRGFYKPRLFDRLSAVASPIPF